MHQKLPKRKKNFILEETKNSFGNALYKRDFTDTDILFFLKQSCMERKTPKSDFGAFLPMIVYHILTLSHCAAPL